MTLVRWNPNGNAASPAFSRFVDNWFDNFFSQDVTRPVGRDFVNAQPAVNVHENADRYTVEVAAPGLKKENFSVRLHNNVLTIASKTEQTNDTENGKYTRKEFSYRSFERSFSLPKTVDGEKIEATYTDGILHVVLPKRDDAKEKPVREIEIA